MVHVCGPWLARSRLDLFPRLERGGAEETGRYEVSSFQTRVRQKFLELMDFLPELNWSRVNADGTQDAVFEDLYKSVISAIEASEEKTISVLWECLFQKEGANR